MIDLGKKLQAIRKYKGISSYQLEYLSGVTQATISKIESNKQSPSIETLLKLCNALEISINELLETNEDLPIDMINLINTSKKLSPIQRQKVTEMLESFLFKD